MGAAAEHIDGEVSRLVTRRLADVSGHELLARLAEAGLVERGCVVMVSLGAIRERLGDRWGRRRDQVWESAMAHIERRLGPQDVAARVSETEIAVAVLAGAEAAQDVGLKCLQELLIFFLGAYDPGDMRVKAITSVSGAEIVCVPIEPPLSLMGELPSPATPSPVAKAPDSAPNQLWSTMSFTSGGVTQGLEHTLVLETLLSLRKPGDPFAIGMAVQSAWTDRVTGRRASPHLRANFTLAEQLAIDRSALEFASQVLQIDGGALVVPVSFEVASSSRGRALLSGWMSQHTDALASRIILELVHLTAGTPRGRLREVASSLMARSPRLIARAEPSRAMVALLKDCPVSGVSLDCSTTAREHLPGLLNAFGSAAKSIAPILCALGVPSSGGPQAARAAGFSHATLNCD